MIFFFSNIRQDPTSSTPVDYEPKLEKRKKKRKKELLQLKNSLSQTDLSTDDQDLLIQSNAGSENAHIKLRSSIQCKTQNSEVCKMVPEKQEESNDR